VFRRRRFDFPGGVPRPRVRRTSAPTRARSSRAANGLVTSSSAPKRNPRTLSSSVPGAVNRTTGVSDTAGPAPPSRRGCCPVFTRGQRRPTAGRRARAAFRRRCVTVRDAMA
jgi:hypothetical protein